MAQQFGLTPQGFIPMQQQDVISDLSAALKTSFGANINLAASSNFGQVVGLMSERLTLLWQMGEAIYTQTYPGGAEGTAVDNILSLNNLKRLTATATKTAPENVTGAGGIVEYPLVLFGTPGTQILGGSVIQTSASPPLSFTLDSDVTIAAASNAVQAVYFGNTPNSGSFSLSITDPSGNSLTMEQSPYNVLSAQSQVSFSAVPDSGNFKIAITQAGATLTTANIPYTANASAVQAAIQALSGYSSVTVSGTYSAGFVITWGSISNPTIAISSNTLMNGASTVTVTTVDSLQSTINNALDATESNYPYTDVIVSGTFGTGFLFSFGAGSVVGSNPNSAEQQQSLMVTSTNTLQMGITVTNMNIVTTTMGNPAQAVGSATCTVTGPNFVGAGALTVIGTATAGWAGVTNQLDCVSGQNAETDTDALVRRSNSLAENANGPIQAIIEKVAAVSGVINAIGFQNQTLAAQQLISFSAVPVSGSYQLTIGFQTTGSIAHGSSAATVQAAINALTGYSDVLVSGTEEFGFTVDFNGAMGGQGQPQIVVSSNSTGVTIVTAFGRPGGSFEIVALGGADMDIAEAIYNSMPAGTQSYGNTTVELFDKFNNPVFIKFSRPSEIPIYVVVSLLTDYYNTPGDAGSGVNPVAKFVPGNVGQIQTDIVDTGSEVSTGGLVIGFGSNGLVGAFNAVPGILSYTMFFGTSPNPTQNVNIQMLSEQIPLYEAFNVVISWT